MLFCESVLLSEWFDFSAPLRVLIRLADREKMEITAFGQLFGLGQSEEKLHLEKFGRKWPKN